MRGIESITPIIFDKHFINYNSHGDYSTNNANEGGGGTVGAGAIQDYRQQQSGSGGNNGEGHGSIKLLCCASPPSPSSSSTPNKCLKILAFSVAFLLLAAGGITVGFKAQRQITWISVDGTIVDTVLCSTGTSSGRNGDGQSNPTYAPVIEYRIENDGASVTHRFTSNTCSWPAPRVGNTINVLYDPEDPFNAVNGSFVALWLVPIVLFFMATCFCCLPFIPGTSRNCFDGYNMGSGGYHGHEYGQNQHH